MDKPLIFIVLEFILTAVGMVGVVVFTSFALLWLAKLFGYGLAAGRDNYLTNKKKGRTQDAEEKREEEQSKRPQTR